METSCVPNSVYWNRLLLFVPILASSRISFVSLSGGMHKMRFRIMEYPIQPTSRESFGEDNRKTKKEWDDDCLWIILPADA